MVATEEASLEASFANPYSACGFIGGIIFCVSILPQLVKTYRTKSAKDLSYFWQACYLLGLIGISIYGVAYKLWPVAIPLIIEIVFMVTLTVLKYRYDKRAKRKKAAGAGAEDGLGRCNFSSHFLSESTWCARGGTEGRARPTARRANGLDGHVELQEAVAHKSPCLLPTARCRDETAVNESGTVEG
ncbi:unnamed protein product [Closterium sp. Naga37s-1]|nr:unnamed protein product [Closterium sp. Naga37s-1]